MKLGQALIEEGAVELVVPGNLPIGCSAVYLTLFQSPNREDYDRNGCLKAFNDFAEYHNNQLKRSLNALRTKYPFAKIVYADYYGAAVRFFHAPKHHGKFVSKPISPEEIETSELKKECALLLLLLLCCRVLRGGSESVLRRRRAVQFQ